MRLPTELLDIVLEKYFVERWIDSKETCDPVLNSRLISRACDLTIRHLISTDRIFRSNDDAQKALWKALMKGSPIVIIEQLLNRADIDLNFDNDYLQAPSRWTESENGFVPLSFATFSRQVPLVRFLLEKGADVDAEDDYGITALHHALGGSEEARGREEMVGLLLEKGADVNAEDDNGNTPLHWAVLDGNKNAMEMLLNKGANVHAKAERGGMPLHFASARRPATTVSQYAAIAGLLLEKGADIEAKDEDGFTALHEVAAKGDLDVVEWLLEKGADINAQSLRWETPLHRAACYKRTAVVTMLLEKGADTNVKHEHGFTALRYAEKGADTDVKGEDGFTALQYAGN